MKPNVLTFLAAPLLFLPATAANATTGQSFLWDQKLQMIAENVQGPVATAISVILVVFCAIAFGTSDDRPGLKKALGLVVAIVIALNATRILSDFGLSGSLL